MLDATVTSIVASIRRDIAAWAGSPDPLDAELLASGLLAMWHAEGFDDPEPREILARAVLRRLASRPDPNALALLLATAAIAEPRFGAPAQAAVDHLRSSGVPEPIWSRSIGRPALVDAWISTDELDDQSHVLAAYVYDQRPPHAINLIVDVNFRGLIRDAFVADDPDKVRREWTRVSGLPIRALSEQALADLIGRGVEMFDTYLEPPVTDEVRHLMPLLRARLRLLPPPRTVEPPEILDEEREALVEDFAAAPESRGLKHVADAPASHLARWFVDFACDYGAGDPVRWSPIAVEILLADWLPRKAILEAAEVEALPDVLRRFVRFAARRKGLADAVFAETIEAIDQFAPEFSAGMTDHERAGPAKQLVLDMRAAGIDPTDDEAVRRWVNARNAALDA